MTAGASAGAQPSPGVAMFVVLVATSTMGPLAINIILPSLPGIGRDFGVDFDVAQLTLSLFLASMAVSIVLTGPLTDMFGRRPVLFTGIGVYLAATFVAAFAPDIVTLIVARVVQAAGAASGMVISRAMIGDLYDRDRAASMIGYVTMGYGLAPMLAPFIGGVLEELHGWRTNFYFLALFSAAILAAGWRVLPETANRRRRQNDKPTFVRSLAELAGAPAFWAVALTNAFASAVYFTLLAASAFVGEHLLGLSPATYGLYFMLVVLGYIAGNGFTGRHAVRYGPLRLVAVGTYLVFASVAVMWAATAFGALTPLTLFAPTLILGVGNGLVTPNCVAMSIAVRPHLAGTAVGIASGVQLGMGGLASAAIGVWIAHDPRAFPLMAQMMLMAVLCVVGLFATKRLWRAGGPREDRFGDAA